MVRKRRLRQRPQQRRQRTAERLTHPPKRSVKERSRVWHCRLRRHQQLQWRGKNRTARTSIRPEHHVREILLKLSSGAKARYAAIFTRGLKPPPPKENAENVIFFSSSQ